MMLVLQQLHLHGIMTFQVSTLLVEISSGGRNRLWLWYVWWFWNGYSDSRLKDNVRLIHRPNGHNVYTWDWNKLAKSIGADKQPNYGVLADELVSTNPEALEKDENGYWKINYFKLRQNKKE